MASILLIDDEPDVRKVLRAMLERMGHTVVEAANGNHGIDLYRHRRPDAVVTDILMPIKGGLHAIREILELDASARIIAVSGGGRDGKLNFLATARTFPGVQTLRKPFRAQELQAVVEQALATT